jgi:hypothetical protein
VQSYNPTHNWPRSLRELVLLKRLSKAITKRSNHLGDDGSLPGNSSISGSSKIDSFNPLYGRDPCDEGKNEVNKAIKASYPYIIGN